MLATAAQQLVHSTHGCRTLCLLCALRAADARCGEMVRDLACYAAKALQGTFVETAVRFWEAAGCWVQGASGWVGTCWVRRKRCTARLLCSGRASRNALGAQC